MLVCSAKRRKENLESKHAHPVNRGLVKNAADRIWSSYRFYEMGEQGLIPVHEVG